MRFSTALSALALSATLAGCAPDAPAGKTDAMPATAISQTKESSQPDAPQADGPVRQAHDRYYTAAAAAVAERAEGKETGHARNIILFIGDGMGISTVTAARIHAGQLEGADGESWRLAMETLPHTAFSKTYSNDTQVADSASTATAMVTGIKTNSRTLGLTSGVKFRDCASETGRGTDTLFELAERAGRATGIVTTARLTHATPAATYAETASRNWESDKDLPEDAGNCKDIAAQFIDWDAGDGFEIALGGGRRSFLTSNTPDPEDENRSGTRTDGRDLVAEWLAKSEEHTVAFTLDDFSNADIEGGAHLLGLFEPSHMEYEIDRLEDTALEPSIESMTRTAIRRLSQDPDGYVLMVEGGRIDHAHHGVNAARALTETVAFDKAVAAALELTDPADTLILVTADHSHTMTIAGYARRNNPILGKVTYPDGELATADDGLPYTTLGYMNGASACKRRDGEWVCDRADLTDTDTADPDFKQQSLVPMVSETHAGEDVPVYAVGPGSELVSGTIEQNEIFHILARASGLTQTE